MALFKSQFPVRIYTRIWCEECDDTFLCDEFKWSDDPDDIDTECPLCPMCHGAETQPFGKSQVAGN